MKLDSDGRYEVRVVCVVLHSWNNFGECYDSIATLHNDYPFASYVFGFAVIDTKTGKTPVECNDWNDSVEEAIFDYEENVLYKEKEV